MRGLPVEVVRVAAGHPRGSGSSNTLLPLEVIHVKLLDGIGRHIGDADAVIDHVLDKLLPINKHDCFSMFFTYSLASEENCDVVMSTPFLALLPSRLPAKA